MEKRITSHDVARHAQVSQATVSRILAGKNNFSQETIDRVKKAAEELGYKRNVLAGSLSSNRTNLIAVISVKTDNPFVHESLSILCEVLRNNNKKVLYIESEGEHRRHINDILDDIIGYQVDGVIILYAAISKENQDFVRKLRIPIVVFNYHAVYDNVLAVVSDNSEAGRMAAGYLVKKGYDSFGIISGTGLIASEGSSRSRNFMERLRELGYDKIVARQCEEYSFECGATVAKEMFEKKDHPRALFCDSDRLAFGAIYAIRNELGLRIPQDVAVVGFDNIAASDWDIFSLTTFEHDNEGMANMALQYIEDCNNGVERKDKICLFSCKLIVRGSA